MGGLEQQGVSLRTLDCHRRAVWVNQGQDTLCCWGQGRAVVDFRMTETGTKRFLRNTKFRFLFTRSKPNKNPDWVRPRRSSQDTVGSNAILGLLCELTTNASLTLAELTAAP